MAGLRVSGRADKVRALMAEEGLDALLVVHGPNIRWLTGFTGSNGTVLLDLDRMVLFTDARYAEQAPVQAAAAGADLDVHVTRRLLEGRPGPRLGIEAEHLTVSQWRKLSSLLAVEGDRATRGLIDFDGRIESLRRHKDPAEVRLLTEAARIAGEAYESVWPMLAEGATERQVAATLDHRMRQLGADSPSFDTIVASGPNGALPHAQPSDRPLADGDLVVLDFGARVDGYGSDMTRTVVAGSGPIDPARRELHEAVVAAQAAGVAAVAPGVPEREIDQACREVLVHWEPGALAAELTHGATLNDAFTHGTGHGIGLEIHEGPLLSARADGILQSGLVITVEPGAYLPGFGGVRIEDSVVVTDDGRLPITLSPKSLRPWSD